MGYILRANRIFIRSTLDAYLRYRPISAIFHHEIGQSNSMKASTRRGFTLSKFFRLIPVCFSWVFYIAVFLFGGRDISLFDL